MAFNLPHVSKEELQRAADDVTQAYLIDAHAARHRAVTKAKQRLRKLFQAAEHRHVLDKAEARDFRRKHGITIRARKCF